MRVRTGAHLKQHLFLALALFSTTVATATQVLEVLESTLALETRLLESELTRYSKIREQETKALRELQRLSRRTDQLLRGRSRSVEELRKLESELAVARETAHATGRETAELRRALYARMDRLAELEVDVEQERKKSLVEASRLSGFWRIEISPGDEFGLLLLEVDGPKVSGTYRLSNGAQGSIQGTVFGDRVKLERIDSQAGFDSTLEGELDAAIGEIHGAWHRKEVGAGEITRGEWSARRLPAAEERDLEEQP